MNHIFAHGLFVARLSANDHSELGDIAFLSLCATPRWPQRRHACSSTVLLQGPEPSTSGPADQPVARGMNNSIVGLYQATSSHAAAAEDGTALPSDSGPINGPTQSTATQPGGTAPLAAATAENGAANSNAVAAAHPAENATPKDAMMEEDATKKTKSRPPKRADTKRDTRASKRLREAGGSDAGPPGASGGFATVPKTVYYSDLGGIEDVLADIRQLIEYPLMHPEVLTQACPVASGHAPPLPSTHNLACFYSMPMMSMPLQPGVSPWASDRQPIAPAHQPHIYIFFFTWAQSLSVLMRHSIQGHAPRQRVPAPRRCTPGWECSRPGACSCTGRRGAARQRWPTRLRTSAACPSSGLRRRRSCPACQVRPQPPPRPLVVPLSPSSMSCFSCHEHFSKLAGVLRILGAIACMPAGCAGPEKLHRGLVQSHLLTRRRCRGWKAGIMAWRSETR